MNAQGIIVGSIEWYVYVATYVIVCRACMSCADGWTDDDIDYAKNLLKASGFQYLGTNNMLKTRFQGLRKTSKRTGFPCVVNPRMART